MASDPYNPLAKVSSLFSGPEMERFEKLSKDLASLSSSIESEPILPVTPSSVKANRLLAEANEHAVEQSQLLRKANVIASEALALAAAAEADAAAARRAAILANIIATIAIAVAAKDQIIEFVISWLL
jgi:hypothetical protein